MRVALLRHGEVEGGTCFRGSTDDPLTDVGMNQMRAATDGNMGGDHDWDRVISSPLKRCANFATEFSRRHSLPVTFDERFMEIHFGDWEGRSAAELMETDAEALGRFWADTAHNPPPGGEPLVRFQARVLDAWSDIVTNRHGHSVLIVTHGGVIRVLLCHILGIPLSRWHEFEVEHGQLRSLRIGSDGLAMPACETNVRM